MKSRIPIHLVSCITICVIILTIIGCAHSRVIQTSDLGSNNDKKIIVYSNDGRTIQFAESEYRIDTSKVMKTINGEGVVLKDSIGTKNKKFSGAISFSKIDSIQVSEYSPLSSAVGLGIVIVGSATALLLIIAWIIGPIKIG
jgi:hypothetical protein